MKHFEVAPEMHVAKADKVPSAKAVLEELLVLLEDYGPMWYTQEHHDRAVSALLEREY